MIATTCQMRAPIARLTRANGEAMRSPRASSAARVRTRFCITITAARSSAVSMMTIATARPSSAVTKWLISGTSSSRP